jgi:hypothetical protein
LKKILKTLSILAFLLSSSHLFANGQKRCDQLNDSLDGTQLVDLMIGPHEITYYYKIQKIKDYQFDVTSYYLNGELHVIKTRMILEVKKNNRCYFYDPQVENEKGHMQAGPISLRGNLKSERIVEAEFMNADGVFMFMSEL